MKNSQTCTLAILLVSLGAALCLSGCVYPVKISPECQKTISHCLERCPETGDARSADLSDSRGTGDQRVLTDYRSPCEENCHNSCR